MVFFLENDFPVRFGHLALLSLQFLTHSSLRAFRSIKFINKGSSFHSDVSNLSGFENLQGLTYNAIRVKD
jgi:hypothetical protein